MYLTWLEINQKNLVHNLNQFKKISPHSEIWPVVKSNAYGHDLKEVVSILDKAENASGFMVVNLAEALEVRQLTKKPVMVLSYFPREERMLKVAAQEKVSLPIYDTETIEFLDKLAKKIKKDFIVNVKVDTGTSRLGFRVEDLDKAIGLISKKDHLKIKSIFTHYAESESADQNFTKEQLERFNNVAGKYFDLKIHSACSAASVSLPDAQQDIIRLGISLYGLWPSLPTKERGEQLEMELKPVLSWKTKIIQVKDIKAGETVGYSRTYSAKEDSKLAVLPVGYNEGYDRLLSNKAEVLINGKRYGIRGNICMNLSMVELDKGSKLKVGEVVTLLGNDGKENISAEELADFAQTINYEFVTRINPNLPRLIV